MNTIFSTFQLNHRINTAIGAARFLSVAALMVACAEGSICRADDESEAGAPGAAATGTGSLQHKVDSQSGRFIYQIPLVVPPGRQGAQPQLTLSYGSGSANGWCGVGWGLEVGSIQRDLKKGVPIKWAVGSATPLKEYDDADGFTATVGGVSGRLVLVSPAGQDPQEYHQEIETAFLKYRYYSNNHWEVVDKNGNTFFFGQTAASRMENPNAGWTTNAGKSTFRWSMDRVVDINGNETVLSYTKDGGLLYLSNISYNGNTNLGLSRTHTVDFVLTDRPDHSMALNTGYRVETRKLLSEVQMKVSGANVRKYVLGYSNSVPTKRSLLASVTEYGSDFSNALPVVRFAYSTEAFQFGPDLDWPGVVNTGNNNNWTYIRSQDSDGDSYVTMTDIDGDGLPDRVVRKFNNPYTYFDVQRNTGTGFVPTSSTFQWSPIESVDINNNDWSSPIGYNSGSGVTRVDLFDINGDGYQDRIFRTNNSPYDQWFVQPNNGVSGSSGFNASSKWAVTSEDSGSDWRSIRSSEDVDIVDMNGDGLPDRVMRQKQEPYYRFKVQLNTGNGFSGLVDWCPVYGQDDLTDLSFTDINTPGSFIGRLTAHSASDPLSEWLYNQLSPDTRDLVDNYPTHAGQVISNLVVALNQIITNGVIYDPVRFSHVSLSGASSNMLQPVPEGLNAVRLNRMLLDDAYPLYLQYTSSGGGWRTLNKQDSGTKAMLADINGDGLPDRVMRMADAPYTSFVVQLNNGAGFEAPENWGPLDSQTKTSKTWNSPVGNDSTHTWATLMDVTGDGLPDRVMRQVSEPVTNWYVQVNTGSGFAPAQSWTGLDSQGDTSSQWNNITSGQNGGAQTYVDFFDINGDGIPDRVMWPKNTPHDHFVVQLGKGPIPDLLTTVSNDTGSSVLVTYVPSTTWDNRNKDWTTDPWDEGAKSLLSFPVYTVSQVAVSDGFGNNDATTYTYKGGYFNTTKREFRGFQRVETKDSYGLKTVTYFHQGGGYDGSSRGEFQDQEGKQGIPYLVESYDTNGLILHRTLNKVEIAPIVSGVNFPYVSQVVQMDYPDGVNYRATAEQLFYDPTTGNVLTSFNLGEVVGVNLATHGITDLDPADNVRTDTTYKPAPLIGKPDVLTISKTDFSDPHKTRFTYKTRGEISL